MVTILYLCCTKYVWCACTKIWCSRSLNKLQRSLTNQSGNLIEDRNENKGKKWGEKCNTEVKESYIVQRGSEEK